MTNVLVRNENDDASTPPHHPTIKRDLNRIGSLERRVKATTSKSEAAPKGVAKEGPSHRILNNSPGSRARLGLAAAPENGGTKAVAKEDPAHRILNKPEFTLGTVDTSRIGIVSHQLAKGST